MGQQISSAYQWCIDEWYKLEEKGYLPDFDDVLAYDTVKLVRVLDRRLGFLYYAVNLVVILYVVVYIFLIKKQYLSEEKTTGWAICKVMQPQMSHLGIEWDVYDRVTNPGEQGAAFIPTRIVVTRGQTQGDYCESPPNNCTSDRDCDIGDENLQRSQCSPNKRCMRRGWCPAEDPAAVTTESHELSFEDVELWFQTFVHYNDFNLDVSTTDEKTSVHFPNEKSNTYRLRDIVAMAGIEPKDFSTNGAVVLLNILFNCNLDSKQCDLKVESNTVDIATGYNYVHNNVYWEDGVRKRDSYRMYGIRLLTFTTGFGTKTSLSQIILQLSSAVSLFSCAEIVADFWLQNVVPERRHYNHQKVIETEDFND